MNDDADTEAEEPVMDQTHPTEEEQTEREWHLWLIALLVVAGGLLVAFPPEFWPEIGFAVVALAGLVWGLKSVVEWGE